MAYSYFKEFICNCISPFIEGAYAVAWRFNEDNSQFRKDNKEQFSVLMPTAEEWYADPFPFVWGGASLYIR